MLLKKIIIENFIDTSYCVGYRWSENNIWSDKVTQFILLKQSMRYWYADPIPMEIDGEKYVFVEKFDRLKMKGEIAVSRVREKKLTKPITIIREKNHLSFPTVFKYKREYYLIPESSQTKSVEIYKMKKNVYQWEHYYSFCVNKKIVDISVEIEGDHILLLGALEEENPLYSRRVMMELENLENVSNIVLKFGYEDKIPTLELRNGGNFWWEEGRRYIVTQKSTEHDYGMYILLQEVKEMSIDTLKMNFKTMKSAADIHINKLNHLIYRKIGTHTYGRIDDLEVIDLSLTQISFLPFFRKRRGKK